MKHVTREEWLTALRSYLGVKFLHQGRSRSGVDCIGLLAVAARDLGIEGDVFSINGYDRMPNSDLFARLTSKYLDEKPCNRLQAATNANSMLLPGDVCLFWVDKPEHPRHIAVYTGKDEHNRPTFIHSYAKFKRKVVEMPLETSYWLPRLHSTWSLPNFKE